MTGRGPGLQIGGAAGSRDLECATRRESAVRRRKWHYARGGVGGKDLRGGRSSSDKATRGPPVRPRKENNDAQGSKQNILGSLLTQIGPSILEGALSKVAHNGRGNPEGQQTQGSPLTTLFSQVGPSLLSGFLQNGKGPSARGNGGSESSPLQSIMSGLGPVLLAGAVSQGLGGNGRDKDAQSPIQSMISNLGPQLMSSVIKQGLGAGKGRSQDPGPVESIISGLGPLLGKAVQSSFQGDSGKSPVVSILSGLGSNLLSGMTKNGQDKNRYNGFPQHNPPQVRGPNPQVPPRTRQRTDSSNASLPRTPSTGSPNFREGESPRREPEGLKEVQLSAGEGEQEHQARTEDDNTAAAQPPLLRLAAGSLLEWLPDRLSVPQANSTRGAWEMAVNLALGNPKEQQGKEEFWSWMRQLSGSDQQSSPRAATWILQALRNPARTAHAQAISDFYDAMARVQPICQAMETVGGLYNWKKVRD
ncbi:hypothetical protein C7M84_000456 [Penaeus vannamei]|uniref:Uncharacterized protein n=1 Tax=Penaeus vannamei TaxID=6689 RepID=A0A3R7PBC0_PENVA|nr:hypothetical protein C7M84_000456 [Penaeus vannamei]